MHNLFSCPSVQSLTQQVTFQVAEHLRILPCFLFQSIQTVQSIEGVVVNTVIIVAATDDSWNIVTATTPDIGSILCQHGSVHLMVMQSPQPGVIGGTAAFQEASFLAFIADVDTAKFANSWHIVQRLLLLLSKAGPVGIQDLSGSQIDIVVEWDCCRDVQRFDPIRGDVIQMHHESTQGVGMCNHQRVAVVRTKRLRCRLPLLLFIIRRRISGLQIVQDALPRIHDAFLTILQRLAQRYALQS
mmetsp:Transcript_6120/g.16685  ORF Transcript_6120/g.16685 Transcript_6120/m.16685 type:complete len:243 (+) Transcript_6120:218-946(+)